jgi:5S rRNA maturation endonuclease (ribonuclease M5)
MYIDFPRDQVWRTIKGSIMNYVGARLVYDNYSQDNAVLLPCYVDDELVGGIKAIIERDETDKKQLAYLTSEGKWVRKYGLYPYDAALTLMKEKGLRVLVVVEGPRDALRLIQHGIPAVAILGTQNWSVTKKNLLLSSGADYIVLMMDGDASGRSAQKKMYAALHNSIATKKIALSKYSRQLEKKIDPGNCPRAVLTQLKTWVYSVKD